MTDLTERSESCCVCGMVKVRFLRPQPVLHVHCCCADCRQAMEWIAIQRGAPMKQAVIHAYYFENDLADLEQQALPLLYAVKLRESGRTTRLVTKCCHSVLALDHPYYDTNVVCVHSDLCDLHAPEIEPLGRIFSGGWDAAYDGEMPPATACLVESEAMWASFAGIVKRPVKGAQGVRLQDIFAQLPPPMILGLAERQRLLPPLVKASA